MKLLTLFLILLLPVQAVLSSDKFSKSYRPLSYLVAVDDDQTEARLMGFGLDANYSYSFFEDVKASVTAGVRLEAGSNNSLNLKEYSPDREIVLIEGLLAWKPEYFQVEVGAINQNYLNSPLLAGSTVFVGAREKLSLGTDYKLFVSFQQSIPNNQTLASRSGGIEEGTPTFLYNEVGFSTGNSAFSMEIRAGLFKFNNLSSGVANQSRYMGNEVSGTGTLSSFLYDFEGTNISGGVHFGKDTLLSLKLDGQYLFNDKAPDSSNSGQLLRGVLILEDFEVGGEVFENNANSSPSFYNSKDYAHNNRKGVSLLFNINKIRKTWNLKSRFAVFESLDPTNLLISDGQLFSVLIERDYGEF